MSSSASIAWSSPNEKPDHYAATICIRVRPDGYSVGNWRGLSVLRRCNGPQVLSESSKVSSDDYFFFFLATFFAFFAFFAFLAMLPSVVPKS